MVKTKGEIPLMQNLSKLHRLFDNKPFYLSHQTQMRVDWCTKKNAEMAARAARKEGYNARIFPVRWNGHTYYAVFERRKGR